MPAWSLRPYIQVSSVREDILQATEIETWIPTQVQTLDLKLHLKGNWDETIGQWWLRTFGNGQSMSSLTREPRQERKPMTYTAWMSRNQRMDRPDAEGRTKHC